MANSLTLACIMSFTSNNSDYHTIWSFAAPQGDAAEDPALFFEVNGYDELSSHHGHPRLDNHAAHHSVWQTSPSASPTGSDFTTTSVPEDPMYYSATPLDMQSCFPSPVDRTSRSNSFPPARLHSRSSRPLIPEPDPPVVHETFEVETGEDDVVRAVIHRLSDEEKRNLNVSSANRPTFCCMFQGCGRWLLHRAQVKPHLADHGYRFKKPFRCSCGAEFGRQVEAARHVEDKKLCEQCHRSGRKYKGGAVCLRCLRHQAGK